MYALHLNLIIDIVFLFVACSPLHFFSSNKKLLFCSMFRFHLNKSTIQQFFDKSLARIRILSCVYNNSELLSLAKIAFIIWMKCCSYTKCENMNNVETL